MSSRSLKAAALALCAVAVLATACKREKREVRAAPAAESREMVTMVPLAVGGGPPIKTVSSKGREYEQNAYQLSEGKRLFSWFNCVGCHGHGGGGSGPALMDDQWLYGSDVENIAASIREGRPNGMPSFRGRIPDDQIWQLAAYVRSLSGLVPTDAAPSRSDHMSGSVSESRRRPGPTNSAGVPSSAERPQ
jgi:cytochrome c oxidase cbb3-type subunit 3